MTLQRSADKAIARCGHRLNRNLLRASPKSGIVVISARADARAKMMIATKAWALLNKAADSMTIRVLRKDRGTDRLFVKDSRLEHRYSAVVQSAIVWAEKRKRIGGFARNGNAASFSDAYFPDALYASIRVQGARCILNSFHRALYIMEVSRRMVNHETPCGRSYIVRA